MKLSNLNKPNNRQLLLIALPVIAIALTLVFITQPSTASEAIVPDVTPLPVMQQAAGQKLFTENCAQCHGKLADGINGKGPPLVHPYYNPRHHGDIAFYRAAEQGVRAHHWPFGDMPAQPQTTRAQVEKIVAYLPELQRANSIN